MNIKNMKWLFLLSFFLMINGLTMDTVSAEEPIPSSGNRQFKYKDNRPNIDFDYYWNSSRAREWLHSRDRNPTFTNKGTVTRQTRGFLSEFTTAEIDQIAVTNRRAFYVPDYHGGHRNGIDSAFGMRANAGNDSLGGMLPYSLIYYGNPMSTKYERYQNIHGVSAHDKVFLMSTAEIQRYVESRGLSMARPGPRMDTNPDMNDSRHGDDGYWTSGTQTYTGNVSRGTIILGSGRTYHEAIRGANRGLVPALHLKPTAAMARNRKIGDKFTFGRYNSDNSDGHKGNVEWEVINITKEGYVLIWATESVDQFPYNVNPNGNSANSAYVYSEKVRFPKADVDITTDLQFSNPNANSSNQNREQPSFEVLNTNAYTKRSTNSATFNIEGKTDGSSINYMVTPKGSIIRSNRFNYVATENDPWGANTLITVRDNNGLQLTGHLPVGTIDAPVKLDLDYDLPYNGYGANNSFVDIGIGLSNWDVNVSGWSKKGHVSNVGTVLNPPLHTTYSNTRYRLEGQVRIVEANGAADPRYIDSGVRHRTFSNVINLGVSYMIGMPHVNASYNGSGANHGAANGSMNADDIRFYTFRQLIENPGWNSFSGDMVVPPGWLAFSGGVGFHREANFSTNGLDEPVVEYQNVSLTLLDDENFVIDEISLPDGKKVKSPPLGQKFNHRVYNTGKYAFSVRDSRGYVWDDTADIKIDKIAPTVVATHNTSWTNQNVTMTVTALDAESGLDTIRMFNSDTGAWGSWQTATASQTFTATVNGTYRFQVRDRAGNMREITRTVSNIDRSAPSATSVVDISSWTNQNVNITWSSKANGSPLARVRMANGSTWGAWLPVSGSSASTIQTATSNGSYRFQVEDEAGNSREYLRLITNIDKVQPDVTSFQDPTAWTNGNVTITWVATPKGGSPLQDVRTHNGSTWSAWKSVNGSTVTETQTATTNGRYLIEVRDQAGNVRQGQRTVSNIDRVLPDVGPSQTPTAWTNGNVVINWHLTARNSPLNRVRTHNGSSWSAWKSINGSTNVNESQTVTSNGTYQVQVEDQAGNVRVTAHTVSNIDKTQPDASSTQTPTGWTNTDVDINWHLTARNSPLSRLRTHNGSAWGAWKSVNGSTNVNEGQRVSSNGTYRIQVEDQAGNIREITHSVLNIDKVASTGRTTQNVTAWTNQDVILSTMVRDSGSQDRISGVDRMRMQNATNVWSNWSTFGIQSEGNTIEYNRDWRASENGTYTFEMFDRAGNASTFVHTVRNIDKIAPNAATERFMGWTNGNVWIDVRGYDQHAGLQRIEHVNGGNIEGQKTYDYTGQTIPMTARFIATENGTYEFRVTDRAGNSRLITQTVTNIDRTAPNGTVAQTPTNWTNGNIKLTLSMGDRNNQGTRISGVYGVIMRRPNGTQTGEYLIPASSEESTASFTREFEVTDNGRYEFLLRDRAGNTQTVVHTVSNIDRVKPTGQIRLVHDYTRSEFQDGSSVELNMIKDRNVRLQVNAKDEGASKVDYVIVEEQNRTAISGSWKTVREHKVDWSNRVEGQWVNLDFDVAHALDTRYVLTVYDRATNKSPMVNSNSVRHSTLNLVDFKITNVINPENSKQNGSMMDGTMESLELSAGVNVTFDLIYELMHLDTVKNVSGEITVVTEHDGEEIHRQVISVDESVTDHNKHRTVTKQFMVPKNAPKGSVVYISGDLSAELANGATHKIYYPDPTNTKTGVGESSNHFDEFIRFRIVR